MKRSALALFCAIAGFSAPARADVRVSFDFFHNSLAPYGEWVSVGDYGPVWHPAEVDEEWSPYTDGYWAYTDGGWTWVSYEDWGGITYHYGRWTRVGGMGWCWVPGYEWGPAWVSWRKSNDYIGWAPLPPEAHWRHNTGFSNWVDVEFGIGPGFFRFCHAYDFGAPVIRGVCLPPARNVTIINQTVNITNITYRNDRGHAFNGGPDYNWVAPQTRQPVPRLKLVQNTTNVFVKGNRGNVFVNSQQGNTLVVGAPPVARNAAATAPRPGQIKRSIPAPEIDRGWAGLKQDPARESIAAKFKEETKGLTSKTAPARPFNPEQVAVVPTKADPKAKTAALAKAPTSQPIPVPTTADVPAKADRPITGKPAELPPSVVAPPAVVDSHSKPNGKKSPKLGIVPQPDAPATKTLPAVPKPALPPIANVNPQPVKPKADPTGKPAHRPTVEPGKSQAEAAEKALEHQRNAEAAHRKQQALDEQKKQQAAMEKEQRAAASAASARHHEEAARQAAVEQQRAAAAAQQKKEMQRQEAAEAARRQSAAPKVPPPAPVVRTPLQKFTPSVQAPHQVERTPVGRPGTPAPQNPRKPKGKDDDEKK